MTLESDIDNVEDTEDTFILSESKIIDNAKQNFDEFKQNLDRYDDLVTDTIPGIADSISDSLDKQLEINIEKFNYEIKIRLDISEAERD